MHGRLKVKSTAEQLEAKRKEREKKLKLYNGATTKIFQKKRDGELDEELLMLTGEVLAVNPDFYTLWNFRKETFLELQKSRTPEELQAMLQNELHFLESCLKINPKSYGTWHHRCFVMDTMPSPDWLREVDLCGQFLQYDERNFHCWDYRRFVVKRAGVRPEEELDYSMSKISSNFSNYSSWHYRSKLLPVIHPDSAQPMGVKEDILLQEYELVQNGIFTDPDDQSNWFYHRWLLGRGEQNQSISSIFASRQDHYIIVSFAKHVELNSAYSIRIECEGKPLDVSSSWCNHLGNQSFSTTWVDNVQLPEGECTLKVSLVEKEEVVCDASLTFQAEDRVRLNCAALQRGSSNFSQQLSAVKSETLQQELESITQLLELETDNKWAALSTILLMKAVDPMGRHQDILTQLDSLEALDFKRKNYYADLRSKFTVENAIDGIKDSEKLELTSLSFKGLNLTKFYHIELLPFIEEVDLSKNRLTEVRHFSHLQNARVVCLDDNQVSSCEGLGFMPRLENLSLKNNSISSVEAVSCLQHCPGLKCLRLGGNPICDTPSLIQGLQEILPNVNINTDCSS